jgi:hypothetical protein
MKKQTITILQIYPSGQVEKEKNYEIDDNGYIAIGRKPGEKTKIGPQNIMHRKTKLYSIYLSGLGFVTHENIIL